MRLRPWVLLAVTAAVFAPQTSVGADDAVPASAAPSEATGSEAPLPPGLAGAGNPALVRLWSEGLDLERREALRESSERYEALADALPSSAFIRWRLSRNYWRLGERLPVEDKEGRLENFERARVWAESGLELDDHCGECVLWKLAALGRLATTEGVVKSAAAAAKIAELIERGIALHPAHVDNASNVTLANLYYAGAAFYRVVPDWFWLQWVIGVRGDRDRALDYIQKAIALSAPRIDYQVELGAVLVCIGTERNEPDKLAEGIRVLAEATKLEHFQTTDSVDLEHARILMAYPERACGYSRDGWIDLAEAARAH